MKIFKSLLGRRQFLMAATAASASGLVYEKIAKAVEPVFQPNAAIASEKAGAAGKGVSNRYSNLLSPLMIRNVIVKNRIVHTPSMPQLVQGPETYPAETLRAYYVNTAKAASMVYVRIDGLDPTKRYPSQGDKAHFPRYDIKNPAVFNYIDQLIEGIHSVGSLCITGHVDLLGGQDLIAQAKKIEEEGYDVVTMNADIRKKDNVRTAIEQMETVKKATNLLIMMSFEVADPTSPPKEMDFFTSTPPLTLDEVVATAKTFDGVADMIQVMTSGAAANHPTGYNQEEGEPRAIKYTQAIKQSGAKILTVARAGFRDPDENEKYIKSGKTDMIAMARAFIADPDYGQKIYEGRGEDTVPCLLCDKCHMTTQVKDGSWFQVCSVNPALGLDAAVRVIRPSTYSKKVAVIGGGPGGMEAAIVAAERGHKVTLYEKNNYLGGLLHMADFDPYKWPHKQFKNYLVRQVNKAGVEVVLKTEATPEMIKAKGYDAVLVAIGSEPIVPKIPGSGGSNIYNVVNAFLKEKSLGKNVVLIGGGDHGTETALFLEKFGHKVMIISSEKVLYRANRLHYPESVTKAFDPLTGKNFNYVLESMAKGFSDGKVTYVDGKGNVKHAKADSVVVYAGLKPKKEEALKFYSSAKNAFFILGDCSGRGGNIQRVIRSAFFAASQV